MRRVYLSISGTRAVMAAAWALVWLGIVAAPWLASHSCAAAGSLIYLGFSRICHQIPERSFELFGYPLAVCHRCFGIYTGMLLGCLAHADPMRRSRSVRRLWVLGAAAPLAFDALAPAMGFWVSSAASRFSTGLLFGLLISSLVIRGFTEFAQSAPRLPFSVPSQGDIS